MIQDKIFFDEKDPTGLSYNTPFTFYGSYQGRLWSKSPSGSIQYYTQNSDLSAYATTGSNQFSGSQTITGSLTVTGGIIGTTATSSYVEYSNVANKPTLVSGSSQVSFSGITNKPTLVSGSAQVAQFGYAITGSNQFKASQAITGSLVVTEQIVAQTLNVQQVTSSIVYSSGSNIFGNNSSNNHRFTGSVNITGSLSVNGPGAFSSNLVAPRILINSSDAAKTPLLLNAEGNFASSGNMTSGFAITNTSFGRALNMGVFESGAYGWIQAAYINNADTTFALALQPRGGNVGIGTISPSTKLDVVGSGSGNLDVLTISNFEQDDSGDETANVAFLLTRSYTNSLSPAGYIKVGKERAWSVSGGRQSFMSFLTRNGADDPAERLRITSAGNVGIGTTNPLSKLHTVGPSTAIDNSGIMQISTGTAFSSNKLIFGINDGNYTWIQAIHPDVAYRNLALQAGGGNVLIGTATNDNSYKLRVNGTIASDSVYYSLRPSGNLVHEVQNGGTAVNRTYTAFGSVPMNGGKFRLAFTGYDRQCCLIKISVAGGWAASNTSNRHFAMIFNVQPLVNSSGSTIFVTGPTALLSTNISTGNVTTTSLGSNNYTIDVTNPLTDVGETALMYIKVEIVGQHFMTSATVI